MYRHSVLKLSMTVTQWIAFHDLTKYDEFHCWCGGVFVLAVHLDFINSTLSSIAVSVTINSISMACMYLDTLLCWQVGSVIESNTCIQSCVVFGTVAIFLSVLLCWPGVSEAGWFPCTCQVVSGDFRWSHSISHPSYAIGWPCSICMSCVLSIHAPRGACLLS